MQDSKRKKDIAVILAAAGRSKRMGSVSKPYLRLKGQPILLHLINKFKSLSAVREIIIAVNPKDRAKAERIIRQPRCRTVIKLVPGGARRQDSVFNALKQVSEDSRLVLVHDAARPFVRRQEIIKTINQTRQTGAAVLAVPVVDTIKRADTSSKRIRETLQPRSAFWLAQTPQGFRKKVLLAAYKTARSRGDRATDDASLVERLGQPVKIVPGRYDNIKITTREDWKLARLPRRKPRI